MVGISLSSVVSFPEFYNCCRSLLPIQSRGCAVGIVEGVCTLFDEDDYYTVCTVVWKCGLRSARDIGQADFACQSIYSGENLHTVELQDPDDA